MLALYLRPEGFYPLFYITPINEIFCLSIQSWISRWLTSEQKLQNNLCKSFILVIYVLTLSISPLHYLLLSSYILFSSSCYVWKVSHSCLTLINPSSNKFKRCRSYYSKPYMYFFESSNYILTFYDTSEVNWTKKDVIICRICFSSTLLFILTSSSSISISASNSTSL